MGTKPFCGDCPDREACHQGASCDYVRSVEAMFKQLDAVLSGKGRSMSNTAKKTTPADVAAQAAEEKLVVPPQSEGEKTDPKAGENKTDETAVTEDKKTLKDRVSGLLEKAKANKQFFAGVVAGATVTAAVMTKLAKEKAVELVVVDPNEDETTDESAA